MKKCAVKEMFSRKFDEIFLVLRSFIVQDGDHISMTGLDGNDGVLSFLGATGHEQNKNKEGCDGFYHTFKN